MISRDQSVVFTLSSGGVAAVGIVVPMMYRLPQGMIAPLRATANRIATLLAMQTAASA
jgi:hypothetical protein